MEISEIVKNKEDIIKLKKATVKFADSWGSPSFGKVIKSATNNSGVIAKTIVGNTYYWLDSHEDVHVKSIFSKSINENKRTFHLHDHEFKIASQVGKISKVYEKEILWKKLGVDKDGNTISLMADSDIEKEMNAQIYSAYNKGEIDQHSVGMSYVKMNLAVNDEQYEDEYKVWTEIFPLLGNPEDAEEKGYFWAIREAKLIEISAVLMGSNVLTPTLESKIEPPIGTQKSEAVNSLPVSIFNYL